MRSFALALTTLFLAASLSAATDVLTVGTVNGGSGTVVNVPVYVRDVSGTTLGVDAATGMKIQGFGFKVSFSPANAITNASFAHAGVLANKTALFETSMTPQGGGSVAYAGSFAESTNPIGFTSNQAAPGNQIGNLVLTTATNLASGTVITLTIEPSTATLSNQAGTATETTVNGRLSLSNGSITIVPDPCSTRVVAPTALTFYNNAATAQVKVTADAGCAWTAVSNSGFLTVTGGSSGNGNGTVSFSLTQNTTGSQRVGTLTVAGTTVTITQVAIAAKRGDFNYDGNADILWRNPSTGEVVVYYINNGHAVGAVSLGSRGTAWAVVAAADFNADGMTDLVWRNQTTGEDGIWTMNGATKLSDLTLPASTPNWYIEAVGDFTGDGQPDIVWHDHNSGIGTIWRMVGTVAASGAQIQGAVLPWHLVAANDFNGDGQTDLMWRNLGDGQNAFWQMQGTSVQSTKAFDSVTNTQWRIVASADFNNDGRADILWRNLTTGANEIWYVQNFAFTGAITTDSVSTAWEGAGPR